MGADPYASSAPYIDPLIAGFWYGIAPALVDELRTLRADIGPVVDIGAGSGRGVRVIHDALPDAPVLAVEPSVPMRAALLARLADDPLLGDRVTVTASDALDCPLPDRMRAAVCMNMLGHLAPDERRSFWRRLARRLAPGGAIFVNNPPPTTPRAVRLTEGPSFRVGETEYRSRSEAEPSGERRVVWRMTHEELRQGERIASVTTEYDWWVVTGEQLREEWAAEGLTARECAAGAFHAVTAAQPAGPPR